MEKWLASKKAKKNRSKGHDFERKCAEMLRPIFPKVRRHLEYQSAQANGVDLECTFPYAFQCKKTKRYVPVNMIEEIKTDSFLGETPVVITCEEGKEVMAILPFKSLIELLRITEKA